jgi:ribonuclease HII
VIIMPRTKKPVASPPPAPPRKGLARVRVTVGVDEAGRGPALGPMVMAVVALDTRAAASLSRAGLTDSKSYGSDDDARARRSELATKVREVATYVAVEAVEVDEIDRRVSCKELNVLEREVAVRLLAGAPDAHRIIADGKRMFAPLGARFPNLEARDEAESHHAAVAAASVVAKVLRDARWDEIRGRYADEFGEIIGGGYVNDGTRRFLRAYAERYRCLPPEARRSWPHPYVHDIIGDQRLPGPQMSLL